jgi:hypothetical protein
MPDAAGEFRIACPHLSTMSPGACAGRRGGFMNTTAYSVPHWSTAAEGEAVGTSPMELSALGEHLQTCRGMRTRLMALSHAAETMHVFAATRLITTLVLVSVLIGGVSWLL